MGVNWLAFVGVDLLVYAIPGPDFALILRWSTRGRHTGLAAAVGAQAGSCVHMLLAVVGLSLVLVRHPDVLTAVRIVGGLYLAYLGGQLILPTVRRPGQREPAETAEPAEAAEPGETNRRPRPSGTSAFAQGLLTNLTNPKAVLFFAAVLPQFVSPGGAPLWVQVAGLGLLDIALGFVPWVALIVVGSRLSTVLHREAVRRWWDRVTGGVLGALGLGVIAQG